MYTLFKINKREENAFKISPHFEISFQEQLSDLLKKFKI